jgi:hypothetical protein
MSTTTAKGYLAMVEPNTLNPIVNLKTWGHGFTGIEVRHALNQQYGVGKWMYVGRRYPGCGLAQSPLANPYSHLAQANAERVATRNDAIEAYRHWLWQGLRDKNQMILTVLRAIQPDTVLVCWCAPHPCHAEVISRAATWLRTQQSSAHPTTAPTAIPTRVVVCGGRDFQDYARLEQSLDTLLNGLPPVEIISGAAHGADLLGERYARTRGLICHRFPADWQRYGRRAGYVRNQQMVDQCDRVVAFWDGQSRGTKNTIYLATAKGIPVDIILYEAMRIIKTG